MRVQFTHVLQIYVWKGPLFITPSALLVFRELVGHGANDQINGTHRLAARHGRGRLMRVQFTHVLQIYVWKGPLFITPSALLVFRELVHEQANDLNEDDMDTTEAGIGDENEAFMDDENENYMDFEYIRHQLLAQGQKHVIRTQYVNLKKNHTKENIKEYKVNLEKLN
uniref:Uncharacterized protein n=1 Tax=Oryza meridionalis TaxID=40149 RepID=A0A0E0EW56_9ORYZ